MTSSLFKELGLSALTFLGLDALWIGLVMSDHFNKLVEEIQGSKMEASIFPAILCYIVLVGGLYYFVIQRMNKKFDIWNILSLSVPFGLCVFGTYDFTTATIFKKWDMTTAFLDVLWGITASSLTAITVGLYRSWSDDRNLEEVHADR